MSQLEEKMSVFGAILQILYTANQTMNTVVYFLLEMAEAPYAGFGNLFLSANAGKPALTVNESPTRRYLKHSSIPDDGRSLGQWANQVQPAKRTLARRYTRDLGMSFVKMGIAAPTKPGG
jgi:hypothetical protein